MLLFTACSIQCHSLPSYSQREYVLLEKQGHKGQTAGRWLENMILVQWKCWASGHLFFSPDWKMFLPGGQRSSLAVRPMALPCLQERHQASLPQDLLQSPLCSFETTEFLPAMCAVLSRKFQLVGWVPGTCFPQRQV